MLYNIFGAGTLVQWNVSSYNHMEGWPVENSLTKSVGAVTYTTTFPVPSDTSALCVLKYVDRKQRNVKPAITLSVKANIVFNRDKTVFILSLLCREVNVSVDWFPVYRSAYVLFKGENRKPAESLRTFNASYEVT